MEKAAPIPTAKGAGGGFSASTKPKGSAREIIRSLELADDAASKNRGATSHNMCP